MIPFFDRLRNEFRTRFNPSYIRFRLFDENKRMNAYIARRPVASERDGIAFSVVVPTYGIPLEFIHDFVRSLERQTFRHWELCICDDGDPNPEVSKYLERLESKRPEKFRVVRSTKNSGICKATLTALSLARNPYVVLADADDLLHRRALELVAAAIRENSDTDFLYSNHDYMTEWGFRLHPMIKPAWSPELLLHVNYINHLKIVRRDLLLSIAEAAFESDYNGAQDWNLCFHILMKAKSAVHLPFFLYHWRARKGSMADDMFSKPWAVESQFRLRRNVVRHLSGRLIFGYEKNLCVMEGVPEIAFVDIDALDDVKKVEPFLKALRELVAASGEEFIYFGSSVPENVKALHDLAGYCTLPRVACVWPFRADGMRNSYTIGGSDGETTTLIPQLFHRGSYSCYSGNVLCGPLKGLMIRRAIFELLSDHVLNGGLPENCRGKVSEVVGALLSIGALEKGYRNASINAFEYNFEPGPLTLPASYLPSHDPYL